MQNNETFGLIVDSIVSEVDDFFHLLLKNKKLRSEANYWN